MRREEQIHRALASPVRVHLLRLLHDAEQGADVEALSRRVDLHPNTVRSHLAVLGEAGLVDSERRRTRRPGRPRRVYHARPDAHAALPDEEGYRLLAEVLAGAFVSELSAPAHAAEAAGRAWGQRLAAGSMHGERIDAAEALARLTDLLTRFGFEPVVSPSTAPGCLDLEVHRCPFQEVVRHHPEVACAVHEGVTAGALAAFEAPVRLRDLAPTPETGRCVTRLEVGP